MLTLSILPSKFSVVRPLITKTKESVANELVKIFSIMDAPHILQSDNGREFANQLVETILGMWPQCKMVYGKPRHSQSQGSVERSYRDIESLLVCWMQENKTTNCHSSNMCKNK